MASITCIFMEEDFFMKLDLVSVSKSGKYVISLLLPILVRINLESFIQFTLTNFSPSSTTPRFPPPPYLLTFVSFLFLKKKKRNKQRNEAKLKQKQNSIPHSYIYR